MSDVVTKRTSEEIREDIGRTRVGLDFMIDALEGRLSMGSLIDQAMGMLRGRTDKEAPIGALIREHPGPAALITAGVVWLAVENRKDAETGKRGTSKRASSKRSASKSSSSGGSKSASRSTSKSGGKSAGRKSSSRAKSTGG
ncbi:MAG: hypothetical protein KY464_02935 [Gemmatimonadetes bacterium]|nr:hypothetical protein [Gemmatimonadota bacterium]